MVLRLCVLLAKLAVEHCGMSFMELLQSHFPEMNDQSWVFFYPQTMTLWDLWEILKDLPRSNSGRIKKERYLVLKRLSVCACRSGCGSGPWRLREPRLLLALHVRHTDLELCRTHRHGSVGESLTITPVSASSVSRSCWLGAQKRPARL